ncbi:MAG TPA: M48 family metalloprotease [Gammaproteobacteria bacterium]|nr:M48 family metalloprotease [Gammaproteobacteria bacterium]
MKIFEAAALRLSLCALLLVSPTGPGFALNTELPDLGNSAGSLMTPKRERDLGKAFMRNVRRSEKVMDDPLLTDYIQSLGQRLIKDSTAHGTPFTFFVVDDPQINAFAGPGGYIGVFSGLILTTETESELAAVLAHEIAHVTQQHLLRAWESTGQMSVPSAAVLLAAIVLGAAVGGDAAAAAAIGGQAALIQQQINFTRGNEQEADRVGIDILAQSGYEPRAMPSFFERMGKANRVYASKLPEFLMTHPVTSSRTADALGRAEQYPYRQTPEFLRYHLARMALTQRQNDRPEEAIRDLGQMLEDGRFRNETAVRYGMALAQIRANRLADAGATLDRLLGIHPEVVEFIVSRARVEALQGDNAGALRRLETAIAEHPESYALNVTYAESALAMGEPARSAAKLQRFLDFRSEEPRVYQLLSRAAGDQGKQALGHEYLSEYYYLIGDLEGAILQLEIALKKPGMNFYDSSRLESRLADLKSEQDDEKKKGSAKP